MFCLVPKEEREKLEKNFLRAIGAKEPSEKNIRKVALPENKLDVLRAKYPNVGRPWNDDDDARLETMFKGGEPDADIAVHFGRKPSAIHARLAHLGLIPNDWKEKKKS